MAVLVLLSVFALVYRGTRADGGAARLYVFVESDARPRALQKLFGEQLAGVEVTVFGRSRDFQKAIKTSPPDGALALATVLQAAELKVALQGQVAGSDREAYVLASLETLTPQTLAGKRIGCIDVLGRRAMKGFVGALIGETDIKVVPVTKSEDLLPLLQFRGADGVVLSNRAFERLAARSELPLKYYKLERDVGLPGYAPLSAKGTSSLLERVKRLDPVVNKQIGVETWKLP